MAHVNRFLPMRRPKVSDRRAYAENGLHPFTKTEFRQHRNRMVRQLGRAVTYDEALADCHAATYEECANV